MEIDILGLNGDCAVVVEVKSTLSVDDIRHFLIQLPRFKEEFPEYADKIVYGAVAGKSKAMPTNLHTGKDCLFSVNLAILL